jgi:hypothetical protein
MQLRIICAVIILYQDVAFSLLPPTASCAVDGETWLAIIQRGDGCRGGLVG